jgi:polysaccharide export outer membrane protein
MISKPTMFLAAVAGAAAAASAQQVPPSGSNAYRINPGDVLEVFVWGEERLQREVRVLPDGTFAFPLAGQIDAKNRLPRDLEQVISRGLESQYRGAVPQVTVSVKNPSGLQFSVVGKVRNPGTFTPGRYINALEALSIAGGPTEFAQLGGVVIIRKEPTGLRSFRVRLNDVLKGSPSANDLSPAAIPDIQSGDTVVVP